MLKTCLDHLCMEEHAVEDIIWSESSSLFFKKGAYKRIQGQDFGYTKEEIDIPMKNRLFELGFVLVHKNRKFFRSLFKGMPLVLFKVISRVITRERS
ncbi:MAG: hypothetical protein HXS40_02585 [Theionarchaea archaeon]|nr:hypothetical protein [Theionarchaea archaeon]